MLDTLYLKATKDGPAVMKCYYTNSPAEQKQKLAKVPAKAKVTVVGDFGNYILDMIELRNGELVTQEK